MSQKFQSMVTPDREYEVISAAGAVLEQGVICRSNPQKLAKFLMGKHPSATKVKITTRYQRDRHPRGLSHETRTFVKK